MFEMVMNLTRRSIRPIGENRAHHDEATGMADVRALATEAALAMSVDASPAVLIALWAHDERLHPEERGPRRRAG